MRWLLVVFGCVIVAGATAGGAWYAVRRFGVPGIGQRSDSGMAWDGADGDGRDFRLRNPKATEGVVTFDYEAWTRGAKTPEQRGTMVVAWSGNKVKMFLAGPDGAYTRAYDGILWQDGRSIAGLSYAASGGAPSKGGTPWWATIDRASPPARPARPKLEEVTVGELAALLGAEEPARLVVEHRFREAPYESTNDVDGIAGIDAATKQKLKEGTDAR